MVPGTPSGEYDQLAATAGVADGDSMTLNEIFVAKINRESRGDEQQAVKSSSVTMASRGPVDQGSRVQLIAAAGLSAGEASGMTLQQIAAAKFDRDTAPTTAETCHSGRPWERGTFPWPL